MGSVELLICSASVVVFCWVGCKKCICGFGTIDSQLICLVHSYMSCRYGCTRYRALCGLVCVDRMVVSSAYVTVVNL